MIINLQGVLQDGYFHNPNNPEDGYVNQTYQAIIFNSGDDVTINVTCFNADGSNIILGANQVTITVSDTNIIAPMTPLVMIGVNSGNQSVFAMTSDLTAPLGNQYQYICKVTIGSTVSTLIPTSLYLKVG